MSVTLICAQQLGSEFRNHGFFGPGVSMGEAEQRDNLWTACMDRVFADLGVCMREVERRNNLWRDWMERLLRKETREGKRVKREKRGGNKKRRATERQEKKRAEPEEKIIETEEGDGAEEEMF